MYQRRRTVSWKTHDCRVLSTNTQSTFASRSGWDEMVRGRRREVEREGRFSNLVMCRYKQTNTRYQLNSCRHHRRHHQRGDHRAVASAFCLFVCNDI